MVWLLLVTIKRYQQVWTNTNIMHTFQNEQERDGSIYWVSSGMIYSYRDFHKILILESYLCVTLRFIYTIYSHKYMFGECKISWGKSGQKSCFFFLQKEDNLSQITMRIRCYYRNSHRMKEFIMELIYRIHYVIQIYAQIDIYLNTSMSRYIQVYIYRHG